MTTATRGYAPAAAAGESVTRPYAEGRGASIDEIPAPPGARGVGFRMSRGVV